MRGSTRHSEDSRRQDRRSGERRGRGAGTFAFVLLAGLLGPGLVAASTAASARTDTTVPVVTIADPPRSVAVSGTVVIAGTASDASGVRWVRVKVDSFRRARVATGTTGWSYTLDSTRLTDGSHTISARAADNHGNRARATVSITVDNSNPISPPPGQAPVTLGVWSDGVNGHTTDALEAQIGRMFGGVRYNYKIMGTIPAKAGNKNFDAGRTVFYNNAESENLDSTPILWADIASGKYDQQLAQTVQAFKSDPRWTHATPYLFSFHHEQDVAAGFGTFGTPADYKAAFRHVFTYFQASGILWRDGGQVEMVWDVTRNSINSGSAQQYDPDLGPDGAVVGDYYDVFGVDVYDQVQPNGHLSYTDPHQAFDSAHQYSLSRGKQFGIFEFGVAEGAPGEKATLFSSVASTLRSYGVGVPGSAMALMYSNVTGKQVFYPDSSVSSLTAFITMANDPLFKAGA